MASRRARERQNARPWEQEPEDERHAGDFPEYDEAERCPKAQELFGEDDGNN